MMPAPTRDRGCLYYVPWIALTGLAVLGGAVGVWIHYGMAVYNNTNDGLKALGVAALNMDRPRPAVIATACVVLFIVLLIAGLSLARSFIEAAHDATGLSGAGSSVYLVFNVLVAIPWWIIVLWLVLLIMGCTVWAGLLYMLKTAITTLDDKFGPQPVVAWIPSSGLPCDPRCLNLSYFQFISASYQDSCICDYTKLRAANVQFNEAYRQSPAMLVGVWVMFVTALILLVNFACQFAHTKREREFIRRLTHKQFIGV